MNTKQQEQLAKIYSPEKIEQQWYQYWESNGYFKPSDSGEPYCIILPPPNVTGTLHMGHGFQISLMDALIRYQRMNGRNTLWQVGTDHAGISTQLVVENQLLKQNISREDLGREAFVAKVWEWTKQSDSAIKSQIRRMGASVDWSRECFSLDEDIAAAVRKVFVSLYDEGLIYRGKRLVNWDPTLLTALSDLEVITEEEHGKLWYIRYPIKDSDEVLVVATTRPETMLGDTAVAVHPDDARYQHLIGKQVLLPIADRVIPIIADDFVEQEFGTGCVKITPAHDFNDYNVGQRHDLPIIDVLTPDAKMNENAPKAYQGMDRFEARKRIVAALEKSNLLEKVAPYAVKIPRGERTGVIVEPMITLQWYIKAKPLAEPAIAAVKKHKVQFIPANWNKTYFQWLENIQDWCISRQLWWGHRIPAWYDSDGNVYVADNEKEVRKKYQLAADVKLTQDEDVLDTWFSSALWPFVTLGWPKKTPEVTTFYPTSVLVTGFDIIFFWVARMVMMGLKFTAQIPFHDVYITGLIRDSEGKKMSKSKGNILDPIDLIVGVDVDTLIEKRTRRLLHQSMAEKVIATTRQEFPQGIAAHGTDALRFTYCALATTGRDVRFDMGRIEGYRNFCNKLWNAARYVMMNTQDHDCGFDDTPKEYSLADRWIVSHLQHTIKNARQAFADYRFDLLAQTLYEFTWNEYCDWYLELSKPILTDDKSSAAQCCGTRHTLLYVLENLLRLLHPLMPFITEEIWQRAALYCALEKTTIMLQPYPKVAKQDIDTAAEKDIDWLKQFIVTVRTIRSEMNISPAKKIPVLLTKGTAADQHRVADNRRYLITLAKLSDLNWLPEGETLPAAASGVVDELELHIPMADLIDKQAEMARVEKELAKASKQLAACEQKLANPNYVDKAPAEVVAQERGRVSELNNLIQKLDAQQERLKLM